MGLFQDVKNYVTARQAAEAYGIAVNRNGMARCPFHPDRTPSMKLDRRFHCFGCGADGDAIDLTARLFDLDPLQAAKKLVSDFNLPVNTGYRDPGKNRPSQSHQFTYYERKSEEKPYRNWLYENTRQFLEYEEILKDWMHSKAPQSPDDTWNDQFTEAGHQLPYIKYLLDQLMLGDEKTRHEYYEKAKEEVERHAKRAEEIRSESAAEAVGFGSDQNDGDIGVGDSKTEYREHGHSVGI